MLVFDQYISPPKGKRSELARKVAMEEEENFLFPFETKPA
jgi:hypothetical protein